MPTQIERLVKEFPRLFENGTPKLGLKVGPGWEKLLWDLCSAIEKELPKDHDFSILQVKEKFGGLRFYASLGSLPKEKASRIEKFIGEAEALSFKTCALCGEPGGETISCSGWYSTLCETHRAQRKARGIDIIRSEEKLG
jgi:hypothetical protein